MLDVQQSLVAVSVIRVSCHFNPRSVAVTRSPALATRQPDKTDTVVEVSENSDSDGEAIKMLCRGR